MALIRGTFIVQSDGFNCGPIACLKVMELFSRLDDSSAADCYAKARIRYVVCEEWDSMVKISDEHGSLIVNDTRDKKNPLDQGKADSSSEGRGGLDDDVLSHSSDVSAYQSDYEECIGDDDYNGLLFRPDCSSHCMTRQDKGSSPCHLGHKRVLHARLTNIGAYVLFPSICFHRGYYITDKEVTMTFLTAQLFASFGKKRISRKKWNARTDFYQQEQEILPEVLQDLRLDLHQHWDEHYPATRFPPSRMYKNAKIDTESNRVIHRIDFDRLRHVRDLVDLFEKLYPELQMETVWFIKKSSRGDGFQRWHQDLNGNGTVVATIVLNIDSSPTEEILHEFNQSSLLASSSSSSAASSSSSSSESPLLSPVKEVTTSLVPGSVRSNKKSPVVFNNDTYILDGVVQQGKIKKTIGFMYDDDRDGDYKPSGGSVSRGNSPRRSVISAMAEGTQDNADLDEQRRNFAEAQAERGTDVESPRQERSHEGRQETVAAASTTAIYQALYGTVTTSKFHFSVGAKTPAMSTIEHYAKRQAEMMMQSDNITPQKSNVNTPAQRVGPFLPPFLGRMQGTVVESNNNTWICHGCDEEVSNSKKRCKCGCWKGGVRGPTKTQTKFEVKKAPNYKKMAAPSNAKRSKLPVDVKIFGHDQVDASEGMVVIGDDLPTCSPLTGNNSCADDDATDNDESKTSLSTAAEDREVLLDKEYLRKMGLTKKRMKECDALFFYQLLLPIVDGAESGIPNDGRLGFYETVARMTNLYAIMAKDRGGTRGHKFSVCTAEELVVWDGVVCRNQSNNIAESWMTDQTNTYDQNIAEAMNYRRWLDIKSCLKLNNCMTEAKRGTENYDPTQKYRLVWDALTQNMNLMILRAGKDTTADETTWPNSSYADVHSRFTNKKTDKGGQHVMLLDARRRYVYAYTPRHKFYKQEKGWTCTGPVEVKRMIELINPLIKGNPKDENDTRRQIFDDTPHITLDNFFSGDQVLQYLGERGYQATMTCRRDRLPDLGQHKMSKIFFNYVKGRTVDHRSKVARFEQPIVAVKHVSANQDTGSRAYTLTHCSFQSTGGTNISGVNALYEVGLYVRERNRGRGENKRRWAIEMNEARDTYLKTYSAVDKIDQTLLNYNINYRSWKWWHAPMRHAKAIAMSMAYNIYVQCCEGGVDPEWKMKAVTSTRFKQELSLQMVTYKAWNKKYPGDEMMRGATQQKKNKRGGDNNDEVSLVRCNDREVRVSYEQFEKEKKQVRNGKKPRLCSGDLDLLKEHIQSMKKVHPAACGYCGKKTVMKCGICDVHLCLKEGTKITTISCPFDFHNDRLYGLGYKDRIELFCGSKNARGFKKPSEKDMTGNKNHMKDLIEKYNRENK